MMAATGVLSHASTHADFDMLILELRLEGTGAGLGSGLEKRRASLASFAVDNPERQSLEGLKVWDAIVEKAVEMVSR